MQVVDASVLANALADDGADGTLARRALRDERDLVTPDLIDVETMAVLHRRWLAGTLTDERVTIAITDLEAVDLRRVPTLSLLRRAWVLRHHVTAYDAVYVALAEALDCALVTADRRLAAAPGLRCEVRVVG